MRPPPLPTEGVPPLLQPKVHLRQNRFRKPEELDGNRKSKRPDRRKLITQGKTTSLHGAAGPNCGNKAGGRGAHNEKYVPGA